MLEQIIDPFHIIVKEMVPGTIVGSTDSGQTVLITLKVTIKRATPPGFKFKHCGSLSQLLNLSLPSVFSSEI